MKVYSVRGNNKLGYSIAIPSKERRGLYYRCIIASEVGGNVMPEGTLIYLPWKSKPKKVKKP